MIRAYLFKYRIWLIDNDYLWGMIIFIPLFFYSNSDKYLSASRAAIQPDPAAVTDCL